MDAQREERRKSVRTGSIRDIPLHGDLYLAQFHSREELLERLARFGIAEKDFIKEPCCGINGEPRWRYKMRCAPDDNFPLPLFYVTSPLDRFGRIGHLTHKAVDRILDLIKERCGENREHAQ